MNTDNNTYKDLKLRNDTVFASNSAFKLPIRVNSVYEWHILSLIMLKMQVDFGDYKFNFKEDLKDQKPLLDRIRFQKRSFGSQFRRDEVEVAFPLDILLTRDKNNKLQGYDKVKKALRSLARTVEFENTSLKERLFDEKCKDNGIVWGLAQVIEKPDIRKVEGINYVYFRVPERTWEVLCHWEKGVHVFEISVFFKFERAASVPFYILLADYRKEKQIREIVWPTNYIKELVAPGEYRDYSSFKKKVLTEVENDLKKHSPFYFEVKEYVDIDCIIPASKGRGRSANYAKIEIHYQPDKNPEVDERIELFREFNQLTPFSLDDLSEEERKFLTENLGFSVIKGKSLETVVKLKYYKNYGHEHVENWRTNPGNFFMEYLKRLYDTIMLGDKEIKSVPAYAMRAMQKDLLTYEPSNETSEQQQEKQDAPKRQEEKQFVPSHEQDLIWIDEMARDPEWKRAMINEFRLDNEKVLCGYLMMFRDENISHEGHQNKHDLTRHFINCMRGGYNRDGWVSLYGRSIWVSGTDEDVKKDPLIKAFGYKITKIKDDSTLTFAKL